MLPWVPPADYGLVVSKSPASSSFSCNGRAPFWWILVLDGLCGCWVSLLRTCSVVPAFFGIWRLATVVGHLFQVVFSRRLGVAIEVVLLGTRQQRQWAWVSPVSRDGESHDGGLLLVVSLSILAMAFRNGSSQA
uniref:Uncharacterized protein n=1 Tax=Cannabis sativa TaxID=3483 RepID=A0A803PZ59_CANSA